MYCFLYKKVYIHIDTQLQTLIVTHSLLCLSVPLRVSIEKYIKSSFSEETYCACHGFFISCTPFCVWKILGTGPMETHKDTDTDTKKFIHDI